MTLVLMKILSIAALLVGASGETRATVTPIPATASQAADSADAPTRLPPPPRAAAPT